MAVPEVLISLQQLLKPRVLTGAGFNFRSWSDGGKNKEDGEDGNELHVVVNWWVILVDRMKKIEYYADGLYRFLFPSIPGEMDI